MISEKLLLRIHDLEDIKESGKLDAESYDKLKVTIFKLRDVLDLVFKMEN